MISIHRRLWAQANELSNVSVNKAPNEEERGRKGQMLGRLSSGGATKQQDLRHLSGRAEPQGARSSADAAFPTQESLRRRAVPNIVLKAQQLVLVIPCANRSSRARPDSDEEYALQLWVQKEPMRRPEQGAISTLQTDMGKVGAQRRVAIATAATVVAEEDGGPSVARIRAVGAGAVSRGRRGVDVIFIKLECGLFVNVV